MAKPKSRPDRWAEAVSEARAAADAIESAFNKLEELRSEYEEWRDNLPENLENTELAEQLENVCNLEFDASFGDIDELVQASEDADLPDVFFRD